MTVQQLQQFQTKCNEIRDQMQHLREQPSGPECSRLDNAYRITILSLLRAELCRIQNEFSNTLLNDVKKLK